MIPIISLRSVSRIFRKGKRQIRAVESVSFDIAGGTYLSIQGPSGAGKSTLLALLGALDRPSEGEIRIDGQSTSRFDEWRLASLRLNRIGFVFQSRNLIHSLSMLDNVALPLKYAGVDATTRRSKALAVIERVGLEGRVDHYPSELSGGEELRAAFARALVNKPAVVLADEPTGNLDPENRKLVMDILGQLHREGETIVVVTHDRDLAIRAEVQAVMQGGRIEFA